MIFFFKNDRHIEIFNIVVVTGVLSCNIDRYCDIAATIGNLEGHDEDPKLRTFYIGDIPLR